MLFDFSMHFSSLPCLINVVGLIFLFHVNYTNISPWVILAIFLDTLITLLLFPQMRVLKSDFAKYNVSDDEEMDDIGM